MTNEHHGRTSSMHPIIQFYHVGHSYDRQRWLFRNVDLQIFPGDFVFITGPSGSGKTTFLKLILCEIRPAQGSVLVMGRNLRKFPSKKLHRIRKHIGFVFQDFRLIEHYTVLENVTILGRLMGMKPKELHREAMRVLQLVGLGGKWQEWPSSLSGGEQQRVAIARAIFMKPRILLADEPTGNLDPYMATEIMKIFLRIHSMGTTVVVATHDERLIDLIGGRVFSIEQETIHQTHVSPLNYQILEAFG